MVQYHGVADVVLSDLTTRATITCRTHLVSSHHIERKPRDYRVAVSYIAGQGITRARNDNTGEQKPE
jgi:hypothetical protein